VPEPDTKNLTDDWSFINYLHYYFHQSYQHHL